MPPAAVEPRLPSSEPNGLAVPVEVDPFRNEPTPPTVLPVAMTVLPSAVTTPFDEVPFIVVPTVPTVLPTVVSRFCTGPPRPVVVPTVRVVSDTTLVTGLIAFESVEVTCVTGPPVKACFRIAPPAMPPWPTVDTTLPTADVSPSTGVPASGPLLPMPATPLPS
ncbi:Filamentous hemagglutinin [Pandoraea pnomenusa]|uniref:Filamentous hemagglutinin n=1 Tax=Pandoraea pnomenusa TaxID=93220 RepID=A0ABY6WV29_9BURK|nr:Filamentous hemagglutinin [Pandoraea pnomenusa]